MNIKDQHFDRKQEAQKRFDAGKAHEAGGDLEKAYEAYCQAAELDFAPAMTAIGILYIAKEFRQVEENNMMELILQGKPIFP